MPTPQVLQGAAFHDASNTAPRASHSIPSGGLFSVYASTPISAPPRAVYDALLDVRHWKDWNTFVYDVTITSHPHSHSKELHMMEGTNMTFLVRMADTETTKTKETVTHVEQLRTRENHSPPCVTRIRWSMHNAGLMVPGFLLKVERTNEIEEAEDGTTLYRTWEVFAGWGAGMVKKRCEQTLRERFQDWCRDLKKYVEEKNSGVPHVGEDGKTEDGRDPALVETIALESKTKADRVD